MTALHRVRGFGSDAQGFKEQLKNKAGSFCILYSLFIVGLHKIVNFELMDFIVVE